MMCERAHEANINTEPQYNQTKMQKDFSSTDSPSCDPQSIATKRNDGQPHKRNKLRNLVN